MKLIIDRKIWLRGEGSEVSYLRRKADGKQCCIGILCSALPVPENYLTGAKDADELHLENDVTLPGWLLEPGCATADVDLAYRTNDDENISDLDREQKISEIFARHDIQVEFVG